MRYRNGHDFEFKALRPSQINIDDSYQRKLDVPRVDAIVKEFNGDIFNEPKVSFRDGKYWCFDGMHSIAVWEQLYKGQDKPMLCKVFKGMTWFDECEIFLAQRGKDKEIAMQHMMKVAKTMGRQDVLEMEDGANAAGYEVNYELNKTGNKIVAVTALYKAWSKLGYDTYVEMLKTIKSAWGFDRYAVSANMINGMTKVYILYGKQFKSNDMANSLTLVTPAELIRNGRGSRRGVVGEIVKAYNKRRRTNKIIAN